MDSIKYNRPVTSLLKKPEEDSIKKEKDWEKQRKNTDFSKPTLSHEALLWLNEIPEESRPIVLPKKFPHIVNAIAKHWKTPFNCNNYLDQLTIRQREDRQGFPVEVFRELMKITLISKKRS